ncbi:hypothetical protein PMAYCL1PPCAC_19468, partial [Pristionchus mayeri]
MVGKQANQHLVYAPQTLTGPTTRQKQLTTGQLVAGPVGGELPSYWKEETRGRGGDLGDILSSYKNEEDNEGDHCHVTDEGVILLMNGCDGTRRWIDVHSSLPLGNVTTCGASPPVDVDRLLALWSFLGLGWHVARLLNILRFDFVVVTHLK